MTTTCNHALYAIIDVFTQYYEIMNPILIEDLYSQLKWCIKQDNEQLARSGTNCIENFVISNGTKFDEPTWNKTCKYINEIFKFTIPYALLTWKPDMLNVVTHENGDSISLNHEDTFSYTTPISSTRQSNSRPTSASNKQRTNSITSLNSSYSEDFQISKSKIPHLKVPENMEHKVFQQLLIKCVVQLELIQTIDNIIFYPRTSIKEDATYIAAAQVCLIFLFFFQIILSCCITNKQLCIRKR